MGHCGNHDIPLLLHQADGKILKSCKTIQLRAESRGFVEANQAYDEYAGAA